MKKSIKFSVVISFLLVCLYIAEPMYVRASNINTSFYNNYKIANYSSFTQIRKKYLADKDYIFGLSTAQITIKTKFGNKKAFIIKQEGYSSECCKTLVYIQHNKKIYNIAELMGRINSISKNKKYIAVTGAAAYSTILKYDKSSYKQIKCIENTGGNYYGKINKAEKKYSLTKLNVKYKYYKNKQTR